MKTKTVGISDIAVYVPQSRMDLVSLAAYRVRNIPTLARHFERALRTTGQRAIRFPRPWEDSATMAAEAAARLLRSSPERRSELRYLVSGTESGLDHSKPVSAYVQGMLRLAGIDIPDSLASYQLQHACAGATAGIITTGALLAISESADSQAEFGIVTASDIARYEGKSTAEVTQGAGAAAMIVERNPRLVELDLAAPGYCSKDVDDFFRPLGSVTARVKGQYSMQCYRNNLDGALRDYARRHALDVQEVLKQTDYFVLHAPFRNMPGLALEKMFETHAGMSTDQARAYLDRGGFYRALDAIAETGNTYTASVYINLASLLLDRYRAEGDAICGKRILIGSYGSGSTMILVGGTISAAAPSVIRTWSDDLFGAGERADIEEYERWMSSYEGQEISTSEIEAVHRFRLTGIRSDGYREYAYGSAGAGAIESAAEVTASAGARD